MEWMLMNLKVKAFKLTKSGLDFRACSSTWVRNVNLGKVLTGELRIQGVVVSRVSSECWSRTEEFCWLYWLNWS